MPRATTTKLLTSSFIYFKALSHNPTLRIRFLVQKIGSRRSDGPISRPFLVCSHGPIFRTGKESSVWSQNDHRDIMQNFSAPFIFQEECRTKIEHVLFPSVFQTYGSMCREVIFKVFTRSDFRDQQNWILKNGWCEQAFTHSCQISWRLKQL